MCAIMQKLRMKSGLVLAGSSAVLARGDKDNLLIDLKRLKVRRMPMDYCRIITENKAPFPTKMGCLNPLNAGSLDWIQVSVSI